MKKSSKILLTQKFITQISSRLIETRKPTVHSVGFSFEKKFLCLPTSLAVGTCFTINNVAPTVDCFFGR
jgi:hypothetical protein